MLAESVAPESDLLYFSKLLNTLFLAVWLLIPVGLFSGSVTFADLSTDHYCLIDDFVPYQNDSSQEYHIKMYSLCRNIIIAAFGFLKVQ